MLQNTFLKLESVPYDLMEHSMAVNNCQWHKCAGKTKTANAKPMFSTAK